MRGNSITSLLCAKHFHNFNSRLYMRGNIHTVLTCRTSPKFQFTPLHERQLCGCSTDFFPASYFNSRLYMRGNRLGISKPNDAIYFNSRLYMRGNNMSWMICASNTEFQFTPLHERQQTFRVLKAEKALDFNSRLYMRGNIARYLVSILTNAFQFTPLHERQHIQLLYWITVHQISIHAST